jgi:acetyl-CoA C-acetyltransferase
VTAPVFVLGGTYTDFARAWHRDGIDLAAAFAGAVDEAIAACQVDAAEVDAGHVGNFTAELFAGQGQLGGLFPVARPEWIGLPTARHEAACASGSVAVLAAAAELEAGRCDLACVVGIEQLRNVSGAQAAAHLGVAAWAGHEGQDATYLWPAMFSTVTEAYAERWGLDRAHLVALARQGFANARHNPRAQTRSWVLGDAQFAEDDAANPVIEGRVRRHDCAQLTDGAAVLFLASPAAAARWAARTGRNLDDVPRLLGWGHRTAPLGLAAKLAAAPGVDGYLMPTVRWALEDAWRRAGLAGVDDIDAVELHDCFSITAYMLIDHLGLGPIGRPGEVIASGRLGPGGTTPINPSGGLIGAGHPVGATGVRMLVDAHRQVTGAAGAMQVDGARRVQTINIGGSATTTVSFVVGR